METGATRNALLALVGAWACVACAGSGNRDRSATGPIPAAATTAAAPNDWPPRIDRLAFGRGSLSRVVTAAFSQTAVSKRDPQVLDLAPDIVPRAWSQWDTSGLHAGDYAFDYSVSCQARGVTFIGGLTASVLFADEMSAAEFDDEVGRNAAGEPVAHGEIVPGAYRGALASPGFRQRLIDIAKIQIDGRIDGLFFDEVNSSYIGTSYGGNEGFDDHDVADFGRFLCAKHARTASALAPFDLVAADRLDCSSPEPGAAFDYRGYLARHGVQSAPLSAANPLRAEWGTTVQNRPDTSAGSFVETYPALVYWQELVLTVRNYARKKYGTEIFITANGVFPFVDFQSVGLYDWNADAAGPKGFDYVPVTGVPPDAHFDGTQRFMPVFASLKARSDRIVAMTGGPQVPVLLFLDWPGEGINRYYALPLLERQAYIRVVLAEAYAVGAWFALPLATTTDASTASALGMMDFFKAMRAFYEAHADLFRDAKDANIAASVSASGTATHVTALPDGRRVVHLVNHNYAAGFVPQANVVVTLALGRSATGVTLASPDFSADRAATFNEVGGQVSVNVGTLTSSVAVVLR